MASLVEHYALTLLICLRVVSEGASRLGSEVELPYGLVDDGALEGDMDRFHCLRVDAGGKRSRPFRAMRGRVEDARIVRVDNDQWYLAGIDSVSNLIRYEVSVVLSSLADYQDHVLRIIKPFTKASHDRLALARITNSGYLVMAVDELEVYAVVLMPRFQHTVVFDIGCRRVRLPFSVEGDVGSVAIGH